MRGFAIQTVGPLPIAFAKQMMVAKGAWGWGMRRVMMDYNHWSRLGCPRRDPSRMRTIASNLLMRQDQFGIPVAKVTFHLHDNDKKLIEFGIEQGQGDDVGSWSRRGCGGTALRTPCWCGAYG